LEEFIVPELQRRLGKNPTILIEFGAANSDIRTYLQFPRLRNWVIRLHGLWDHFPFSKKNLRRIGEINFAGNVGPGGQVVTQGMVGAKLFTILLSGAPKPKSPGPSGLTA